MQEFQEEKSNALRSICRRIKLKKASGLAKLAESELLDENDLLLPKLMSRRESKDILHTETWNQIPLCPKLCFPNLSKFRHHLPATDILDSIQ